MPTADQGKVQNETPRFKKYMYPLISDYLYLYKMATVYRNRKIK